MDNVGKWVSVAILYLSVSFNYNALGFPSMLVSSLQRSAGLITLMMISEGQTEYVDQQAEVAPDLPASVLLTAPQCSHGTLDAHARTTTPR